MDKILNLYYRWSKEFLAAGNQRLAGDTQCEADSEAVRELKSENEQLKQLVAELSLKNRVEKKFDWLGRPVGQLMRYSAAERFVSPALGWDLDKV